MARLKFNSFFEIVVREEVDGVEVDAVEARERWKQLERSLRVVRFPSRERAEQVLASLIANDRVAADWCEVEEVAGWSG